MKVNKTAIDGLYEVHLEPVTDKRGFIVRSFCLNELSVIKKNLNIVQMNHSLTVKKGTIRGMHYQKQPFCETKLIRCIRGSVFDVAVDLRAGSSTYLKWYGCELSSDNMKMLVIPEGFAHGFQALTGNCEMLYLHTEFYNKDFEAGIMYNDPELKIKWVLPVTDISARDMTHPSIDKSFQGIKI